MDVTGIGCNEQREVGFGVVAANDAVDVGDPPHGEDDHLEDDLGDGEGRHEQRRRAPDVCEERAFVGEFIPREGVLVIVVGEDAVERPIGPTDVHGWQRRAVCFVHLSLTAR